MAFLAGDDKLSGSSDLPDGNNYSDLSDGNNLSDSDDDNLSDNKNGNNHSDLSDDDNLSDSDLPTIDDLFSDACHSSDVRLTIAECKKVIISLLEEVKPLHKPHKVNKKEVRSHQKKILGPFHRKDHILPYGARASTVNLSMFGQVLKREPTTRLGDSTPFSKYIRADIGVTNHYLITMVARSGSGKTATVVSLAKEHFVIYTPCTFEDANLSDFSDTNFFKLAREVQAMPRVLKKRYKRKTQKSALDYDKDLKRMAMNRVKLEFLARELFLLFLFRENSELKPSVFFREQINGGSKVISRIVENLKIYHSETIQAIFEVVDEMLKGYLNGRALVIALDEAHVTEDHILGKELLSMSAIESLNANRKKYDDIFHKGRIRSQYHRGFFTPLIAAVDSMNATLVVLGTALSMFNVEHMFSASSKPDERHLRITNFPSANEDDVVEMLSLLLDMSDCVIPPEKKRRLTGRFRFTTYIIDAIIQMPSNVRDTMTKQEILDAAIKVAEEKAKTDARADVTKLLGGNNRDRNIHLLCRMLIAFKLKGGNISFPQEGDANFVNRSLCVLIDEGYDNYSFSLKEPLIAEAVEEELRRLNIDAEFFEHFDQLNSMISTFGIATPDKENIAELLFAGYLRRYNNMFIADLPFVDIIKNLPVWCKTVKLQVDKFTNSCSLEADIDYFRDHPDKVGVFPHKETRPDYMQCLAICQPPSPKEYWLDIASKLFLTPLNAKTHSSNTLSSDLRLCFSNSQGVAYEKTKKYRGIFESYGYPGKIGGILRIHFVFPSIAGGTPKSYVNGEDIMVYIDNSNIDLFFDEEDEKFGKEARTLKRILGYLYKSKEELKTVKH